MFDRALKRLKKSRLWSSVFIVNFEQAVAQLLPRISMKIGLRVTTFYVSATTANYVILNVIMIIIII